jgi:predicted secreted protein
MAVKTFSVANVKIGGTAGTTIGNIESANLTVTMDTGEITAFQSTWKTYVTLAKSWQLTVTAKYDNSDAGATALRTEWVSGDNLVTSVIMYENASAFCSGDTILTSYTEGATVNAVDTYSVTFMGNGALSYTP